MSGYNTFLPFYLLNLNSTPSRWLFRSTPDSRTAVILQEQVLGHRVGKRIWSVLVISCQERLWVGILKGCYINFDWLKSKEARMTSTIRTIHQKITSGKSFLPDKVCLKQKSSVTNCDAERDISFFWSSSGWGATSSSFNQASNFDGWNCRTKQSISIWTMSCIQ